MKKTAAIDFGLAHLVPERRVGRLRSAVVPSGGRCCFGGDSQLPTPSHTIAYGIPSPLLRPIGTQITVGFGARLSRTQNDLLAIVLMVPQGEEKTTNSWGLI